MDQQPIVTSRLDNYEVKIIKQSAEIYLEVLNLETFQLYSYTIREQALTPRNKSGVSFDQLHKYLTDGLQKPSEISEFTITPEMKIILFIILSESVISSESFEYQLKEIPFMSPEHVEKLQQRNISSCLPKNMMGALFAMMLANQQNINERLKESEDQLKETKGDVQNIVKIGFKNLETKTKKIEESQKLYEKNFKEIQGERQTPEGEKLDKEQNKKLEEAIKQIQEENKRLKEMQDKMIWKELQEIKEDLEKKADKPKKEFNHLDEIPLVNSVNIRAGDVKGNYSIKEVDEKFTQVYDFIKKSIGDVNQKEETQQRLELLREEILQRIEEQNQQINQKLQGLNADFENIKKALDTLDHKVKGDVESFEEKISRLQSQIETCQAQIDVLQAHPAAEDHQNLIDYVNLTIQEVQRNIRQEIDTKQAENSASFVSQLEEFKENITQKVQDISGRVEAGLAHIQNTLQVAEDELKIKIETTHLTLTEFFNAQIGNKDKLNAMLSKKIAILERRFIPSQAELQTFEPIKPMPTFNSNLEDISVQIYPGGKTIYCDSQFAFVEKSFYSEKYLPDTGKYSFSLKYEGGEFKENGLLCFGVFPEGDRENPQASKHKYLIDIIKDEAYLEDNKFSFEAVDLRVGGIVNVYVDCDRRNISFSIGNQVILNYPLSNWVQGKMYCGFFVRNNKNIRMSFV